MVTGDIAQSGKWSEYEKAGKWLDQLAESIGVKIHQVQMVPGNHDLDRSKLSFSGKKILDYIRAGGAPEYEAILNDPTDRAALFARFEDYGRFSFGYNCPLNDEGAFASEMMVNLAPGRAIRFTRLNSSLLCHGAERDEHPELWPAAGSDDTALSFSSFFKLNRTEIPQRRMTARRIIEALDVIEHV